MPLVNAPDYQGRLYKRMDSVKWVGRLHEKVQGAKVISELPPCYDLSLIHIKTIDRQTKQNTFYNQNFTESENRGICQ